MANATSESSNTSGNSEGERIFIPSAFRGQLIKIFELSVRLSNVLEYKNIRLTGELHGLYYAEFSTWRNCGRKTVVELQNGI